MKKTKTCVLLFVFSVLICAAAFLTAGAAPSGITLSGAQISDAETGQTYSVPVVYSGLSGQTVQGITAVASWDTASLELISVEKGTAVLSPSAFNFMSTGIAESNQSGVNRAVYACAEGKLIEAGSGELFVYTFRVKEGAANYMPIALSLESFGYLGDDFSVVDYSGSVTVTDGSITLKGKTRPFFDYVAVSYGLSLMRGATVNGKEIPSAALFLTDGNTQVGSFSSMISFSLNTPYRLDFKNPDGTDAGTNDLVCTGTLVEAYIDSVFSETAVVVVKGDADMSGKADVFDAVALLSWIVDKNGRPLSLPQLAAADTAALTFLTRSLF